MQLFASVTYTAVPSLFSQNLCIYIFKVSIVRSPHFFWCFHSFSLTSIHHHVLKTGFPSSLLLLSQKHLEVKLIPRILQAENNPSFERFTV